MSKQIAKTSAIRTITNNPVANAFKFVASALFGLPVAAVSATLLGIAFIGVNTLKYADGYFTPWILTKGQSFFTDTTWAERSEKVKKMMSNLWNGFGFYAIKETVEFFNENVSGFQSELGFGNAKNEDPSEKENLLAKSGSEEDFDKHLEMEIEKIDRGSGLPGNEPQQPLSNNSLLKPQSKAIDLV